MKIGFIGAGKVGCTFAKYLTLKNQDVQGFFSQDATEAKEAAQFTNSKVYSSIANLVAENDTIFITTTDTAIAEVWNELKDLPIKGKTICHCSGATSTDVFEGIKELGAFGFAVHPLCMVSDKFESYKIFGTVAFTVEGDSPQREDIIAWMRSLGNPTESITKEAKALYHAAGVALSSLLLAVTKMGVDLYSKCGLNKEFIEKVWPSLFIHSAQNIYDLGLINGLSGPLERGDYKTIRSHMNAMNHEENEIYIRLSKILLSIAKIKNPNRDYSLVEKELNQVNNM